MRPLLLTLTALSLAFAPAPFLPRKPPPAEADEQIFQGEWTEMDTSNERRPNSNNVKYVFTGKNVRVLQSGTEVSRWTMTLNTAATPKIMNLAGDRPGSLIVYQYTLKYTLKSDATAYWVTFKDRGVFMRKRR